LNRRRLGLPGSVAERGQDGKGTTSTTFKSHVYVREVRSPI
jgi:hypothetical protein